MHNLPPQSDLEEFLRENPAVRAQVSKRGAFNSALPDALRIKRQAIELRRQLAEAKASLDHYAQTREQSKKQIAHGEKTLAALKTCRAKTPPAKLAPKASTASQSLVAKLAELTGSERTRFYQKNERAIRLEILRTNSPTAIIPNR